MERENVNDDSGELPEGKEPVFLALESNLSDAAEM